MTFKEQAEELEQRILSPYAVLSSRSRGRLRPEPSCDVRTDFCRDRDRIIHCSSFRRLKHKTQVFLSPMGDHYRTRLTHTLEVAQIARTIARALRLNEDLTEAIALGHDLGHTPFGHAGERALNEICPMGFRHALHSVRVVHALEKDGKGLNLTYEVKNGIACHSLKAVAATLEGRVVKLSDKVAYINHDIEDALRAGVLTAADLPYQCTYILGRTKSERISTVIHSVIRSSSDEIRMDPAVWDAHSRLRDFMFEQVYKSPVAKAEEGKAEEIVKVLYAHFVKRPAELPPFYRGIEEKEGADRAVCDYIAGMTDRYAVELFERLFVPRSWPVIL
ncbi:MAG: deoxyguanosinetriphosphate triphosphohydrolase [Oscillospiraceae bacterium]|nr:deoxyguanosinetriphosphate triphosphohydrolase [Oscillospiraceae bacterium]